MTFLSMLLFRLVLLFLLLLFSSSLRWPILQNKDFTLRGITTTQENTADLSSIIRPKKVVDAVGVGSTAYDIVSGLSGFLSPASVKSKEGYIPVAIALQKIQKDMRILDEAAGNTAQLSSAELAVLISTVTISAVSPWLLGVNVVELLVPSMAALSAAIGISAEYTGKVAVAVGKEIASASIQAAAEAEGILAVAERTKAVLPLCVGIATTASAFALLTPTFVNELTSVYKVEIFKEIFLLMPFVSVISAAVAALATAESNALASRAIGTGNRRFASSSSVGRSWLSATEQIELNVSL